MSSLTIYSTFDLLVTIKLKKGAWVTCKVQRHDFSESKSAAIIEPVGDLVLEYPVEKTRKIASNRVRIYLKDIASSDVYKPEDGLDYHAAPELLVKQVAWPQWIEPKIKPTRRKKLLKEIEEGDNLTYYMRRAIEEGFQDLFVELLPEDISFDVSSVYSSFLYKAVEYSRAGIIKLLMEHNYPLPTRSDQESILRKLKDTGNPLVLKLLLSMGFNFNGNKGAFISKMVENGHAEAVKILIDHGVKFISIKSLLKDSIESGNIEVTRLLIEGGVKLRSSAFIEAIGKSNFKFMELFLAHEADVNGTLSGGSTILIETVRKTINIDRVQLLLDRGADPTVLFEGKNITAYAEEREYPKLVKLLEDNGIYSIKSDADIEAAAKKKEEWEAMVEAKRLAAIPEFLKPDTLLKKATIYTIGDYTIYKGSGKTPSEKPINSTGELALIGTDVKAHYGLSNYGYVIAEVRAKLQYLFGAPSGKGDEYKTSFEYHVLVEHKNGTLHHFLIADWKARTVYGTFVDQGHPAQDVQHADAILWELISKASFEDFKDKFRYDEWSKLRYECVDGKPWEDIPMG